LLWKGRAFVNSVSADGKQLLFGSKDIQILPLEGEKKPAPYFQTKFVESGGAFSPDGRCMAYASDESGRSEIYIQGFPERRGKWLVSAIPPRWRGDGKELYWLGGDGRTVMAAPVELQATGMKAGRAAPLFRLASGLGSGVNLGFQVTGDGRRFLVQEAEGEDQAELPKVVLLNWAAGLGK